MRGRGVGEMLVRAAVDRARAEGAKTVDEPPDRHGKLRTASTAVADLNRAKRIFIALLFKNKNRQIKKGFIATMIEQNSIYGELKWRE